MTSHGILILLDIMNDNLPLDSGNFLKSGKETAEWKRVDSERLGTKINNEQNVMEIVGTCFNGRKHVMEGFQLCVRACFLISTTPAYYSNLNGLYGLKCFVTPNEANR